MSDEKRARGVPTILAAVVALAVSAAPAASAGSPKPKQRAIVYNGHAGLGANARAIVTDNKDPDKLGAARSQGVIASVNVKYT